MDDVQLVAGELGRVLGPQPFGHVIRVVGRVQHDEQDRLAAERLELGPVLAPMLDPGRQVGLVLDAGVVARQLLDPLGDALDRPLDHPILDRLLERVVEHGPRKELPLGVPGRGREVELGRHRGLGERSPEKGPDDVGLGGRHIIGFLTELRSPVCRFRITSFHTLSSSCVWWASSLSTTTGPPRARIRSAKSSTARHPGRRSRAEHGRERGGSSASAGVRSWSCCTLVRYNAPSDPARSPSPGM